jgi:hypothetical protein
MYALDATDELHLLLDRPALRFMTAIFTLCSKNGLLQAGEAKRDYGKEPFSSIGFFLTFLVIFIIK